MRKNEVRSPRLRSRKFPVWHEPFHAGVAIHARLGAAGYGITRRRTRWFAPSSNRPVLLRSPIAPDDRLAASSRDSGRGTGRRPACADPRKPLVLGRRFRRASNTGSRNCRSRFQYCSHGKGRRRCPSSMPAFRIGLAKLGQVAGKLQTPAAPIPLQESRPNIPSPPPRNRPRVR